MRMTTPAVICTTMTARAEPCLLQHGKTLGALAIATGIAGGGPVAVGDSENGSASLYAGRYSFDTVLIPDAEPATYKAIVDAAVAGGYAALVLDSLSHAWLKVLAEKEDYDRTHPATNSWTNWRIFGPKWDGLMAHILQAPIHIVATMRSKQAYEQTETGGKKKIVKLGLQPQVREGAEYEFGLVFSVEQNHLATASKDRTDLFKDREVSLLDPRLHQELIAWMNAGGPMTTPPASAPAIPSTPVPTPVQQPNGNGASSARPSYVSRYPGENASAEELLAWAAPLPLRGKPDKWGGNGGKPLGELPDSLLQQVEEFFGAKAKEKPEDLAVRDQWRAAVIVRADRLAAQTTLEFDGDGDEPVGIAAGPDPDAHVARVLKDTKDDLPF
jgi:hypothetical protein